MKFRAAAGFELAVKNLQDAVQYHIAQESKGKGKKKPSAFSHMFQALHDMLKLSAQLAHAGNFAGLVECLKNIRDLYRGLPFASNAFMNSIQEVKAMIATIITNAESAMGVGRRGGDEEDFAAWQDFASTVTKPPSRTRNARKKNFLLWGWQG